MPDTSHTRHGSLLLAVLLFISSLSSSVLASEQERWYGVELMIFRHLPGDYSEQFEASPELRYPARLRYLQAAGSGADATTLLTPFERLGSAQREFAGKAAYMRRSGRYQILFHERWQQPMAGKATTVPIIIDRNLDGAAWPELQGSIKLYLSRYLHLETNIWLNTDGSYLDSEWQMEAPPLAHQLASQQDPAVTELDVVTEPAIDTEPAADTAPASGPAYPYRHAILLQQKRRMRSEEVHYIDHPVLGGVIKLTPIELPEEDDLPLATEPTAGQTEPGVN